MNLPNGTLLQGGKYRIEGVLGQGGFGITYLATHTALGSRVAVKEYFDSKVNSRGADGKTVTVSLEANRAGFDAQRTKFRKEAQRMQALDCEHIAKVWDFFDENGTSYYVMEYIDGGSLEQRLRQHGTLGESEVRDVLGQMLDALQAIHARRIWHLDLKPGNIMCAAGGRLKLIDFGASKLADPGVPTTTSSAVALTPGFAPLEQIAGDMDAFGPWTDFYALGATLYALLTGNRPPLASDILSNGTDSFAWPSEVTSDTRGLIVAMMNPVRNKRPQNVAEVKMFMQKHADSSGGSTMTKRERAEKYYDEHDIEILQQRGFFEQKKAFVKKIMWSGFLFGFVCACFFVMWYFKVDDLFGLIFCCIGGVVGGSVTIGISMLILAVADNTVHNRLRSQIRENFIDVYIKTH